MPNTTVTYWKIESPDEYQHLLGWRWVIKTQRFTMVSDTFFTTKDNCKRSALRFVEKHGFDYWGIDYQTKERTDTRFLI